MKLYDKGIYLLNGREIIEDGPDAAAAILAQRGIKADKKEAAKGTMAYNILKDHNTSGSMDKLKIKFDKMTSHDITFVGIIQTAGIRPREVPDPVRAHELPQQSLRSRRNDQRR